MEAKKPIVVHLDVGMPRDMLSNPPIFIKWVALLPAFHLTSLTFKSEGPGRYV